MICANTNSTSYPLSDIGSHDFLSAFVLGSLPRDQQPFVTCRKWTVEVTYQSPVVVETKALPLDWLLGQKDWAKQSTAFLATRVLDRLQKSEAHEVNPHLRQDIRQAWITTSFAQKNVPEPFVAASYACYGVHPDKVWPNIVADNKARLGKEYYDWFDSANVRRPDVPRIPPNTANADTHAAHGAGPTGTGRSGSVPNHKEVV